jgi:DNA primase
VLNLLKHGIKNAIAMNGTSVPDTIIDLSKKKVITAFVDGDRGGNLIIKELTGVAEIDHVCRAPDGKEVEELTKKEIHKALRGKASVEQALLDTGGKVNSERPPQRSPAPQHRAPSHGGRKAQPTADEKKKFKEMLDDLIGTRGAYILDNKLNILGKVPLTELATTLKSLSSGVYALVFDGSVERDICSVAERTNVRFICAMNSKVKPTETRLTILTSEDF